jgi:hypothetical protein
MTTEDPAAKFMAMWEELVTEQPSLARDFIWANYMTIYEDQAEVARITAWLHWWDVWPVSWEDICDLASGALTDEQRQLRDYRSHIEFFGASLERSAGSRLPQGLPATP